MIKHLTAVSLLSGGGLVFTKLVDETEGGVTHQKELNVKNTAVPHPDLTGAFEDLGKFFLRTIGLDPIPTFIGLKDNGETVKRKNAAKALEEDFVKAHVQILDNLEVTKISLSGSEEKPKVVISGKIRTPLGGYVAFNSPLISLTGTKLGFEPELYEAIESICEEAEKYDQEKKRAQLEMPFGEPSGTSVNEEGELQGEVA